MRKLNAGKDDGSPGIWFHTMAEARGTSIGTRQDKVLDNINYQES